MSKSILDTSLLDAIPDSLRYDEDVAAIAESLDGEMRRMAQGAIDAQWSSPAVQTGSVDGEKLKSLSCDKLDHVAWSWGSIVWDRDWSDGQKKAYAPGILDRKKHLGTAACIRDAFAQIGIDVEVADCMTDSSIDPGTFNLYTDDPIQMGTQWKMLHIVDRIKPVSRKYKWGHRVKAEGGEFAGGGVHAIQLHRFDYAACQPVYRFSGGQYTSSGAINGVALTMDFEAIQPPEPSGPDIRDGLVGFWSFALEDRSSDRKKYSDSSGNGIVLTSSAAQPTPPYSGKVGYGIGQGYVSANLFSTDSLQMQTDSSWSWSLWVWRTASGWTEVGNGASGGGPEDAATILIGSSNQVRSNISGTSVDSTARVSSVKNVFTHICVTCDASANVLKIYIDSVLDKEIPYTQSQRLNIHWLFGRTGGTKGIGTGIADEFGVWNRALTAEEVASLYAAGNAGVTYPFEGY